MDWPKRGEIWVVNLDPAVGAEIKKTRPALIVSNDINNRYAGTVTLLLVSDQGDKIYPFEVPLPSGSSGLQKASKVKCQQVRTVDKIRLTKRIGIVSEQELRDVERAIMIHLGIE